MSGCWKCAAPMTGETLSCDEHDPDDVVDRLQYNLAGARAGRDDERMAHFGMLFALAGIGTELRRAAARASALWSLVGTIRSRCTLAQIEGHANRLHDEGPYEIGERIVNERDAALIDADEERRTRERLAVLLEGVADALKGAPGELEMHDWSDLPALATEAMEVLTCLWEWASTVACRSEIGDRYIAAADALTRGARAARAPAVASTPPCRHCGAITGHHGHLNTDGWECHPCWDARLARERAAELRAQHAEQAARVMAALSVAPTVPMLACSNFSPPWFTGRWRDWHRGHGCSLDDGKPRTTEGEAEIAKGGA